MFDKNNFFDFTQATFKEVDVPPFEEPNFISYSKKRILKSNVGYHYTKNEVLIVYYRNGDIKVYDGYTVAEETATQFILYRTSKPSSYYWYTEAGVFRKSNHWGKLGTCDWVFIADPDKPTRKFKDMNHIGFCQWGDFQLIETNF